MSDVNRFTDLEKARLSYEIACKKRLILFLSVDIIGSTRYKYENPQGWMFAIEKFYTDFCIYFRDAYANEAKIKKTTCKKPLDFDPHPWKILGDEIIYVLELNAYAHALGYVAAFRKAVIEYSAVIRQTTKDKIRGGLCLKAAAWLADFPVGNMVMIKKFYPDYEHATFIPELDYIGPLVDIGFRLAKYATEQCFVVSVDLALLLSELPHINIEFFYDGKVKLKGVLKSKSYPLIWIKMEDDEFKTEGRLRNKCHHDDLKTFCQDYIADRGKPLLVPVISDDDLFGETPEYIAEYERKCKILQEIYLKDFAGYEVS